MSDDDTITITLTNEQLQNIVWLMERGAEDVALAASYKDNGYTDEDVETFDAEYADAMQALGVQQ